MGSLLNLTRWMQRLGYRRQDEPSLVYSLQPVQVVGDASQLSPALLGPTVSFGGRLTPAAGSFASISVHVRSEGGALVRGTFASGGGWGWLIQDTVANAWLDASLVPQTSHPDWVSLAYIGEHNVGQVGTNEPSVVANAVLDLDVFVPAGMWLFVQGLAVAPLGGWLTVEEYPGIRGD